MKKKLWLTVVFYVALAAGQQAMAWGVTGHRVVAEVAQRHLSKKAKKAIAELIGNQGLAYWANWSDFVKSDTTGKWKAADAWHYINISGNLSKERFLDSLPRIKAPNVYGQIQALQADVKNTTLSLQARREAFVFILHLVGDMHQPLHVGRAEDLGGNRIPVYWFDKKTNLHSVWDNDLVGFQQYGYKEFADVLNVATKEQVAGLQNGTLADWLYDTYQLANKVYSMAVPEERLGYKYNYIFQEPLEQQLLKGGLRLAALLNQTFN
ncbi:MAG: S1/P1 Nuclease [Bacteroidetes bacterium]|nr:MAG: S1/P1 Nuclease [Bacteroidota bacterium]